MSNGDVCDRFPEPANACVGRADSGRQCCAASDPDCYVRVTNQDIRHDLALAKCDRCGQGPFCADHWDRRGHENLCDHCLWPHGKDEEGISPEESVAMDAAERERNLAHKGFPATDALQQGMKKTVGKDWK